MSESITHFSRGIRLHRQIDAILRGQYPEAAGHVSIRRLAAILLFAGFFYGAVMGAYGGIGTGRFPQICYSAAKVPLLLLMTFVLSLPSFFVFNSLLGLRDDFGQAVRAVGSAQVALTIVLASFAPFTATWYLSVRDYHDAILFNAAMFAFASVAAQLVLRRSYRPLIQRSPRHRWMLGAWLTTYAFVGVQMGWVLRPFIGNPDLPTGFFRAHAFTNAYEFVGRMILEKMR